MITITLTQRQKNRLLRLLGTEIFRNIEFLRQDLPYLTRLKIETRTTEYGELAKLLKG